jgi:hypothetical protein
MMNDQVVSCPERTSIMLENLLDCMRYSEGTLAQARDARQSSESEHAALVAEAQVGAILAVAVAIGQFDVAVTSAIDRLTGGVEHMASAVERLQRHAGPQMPRQ